MRTKAGRTAGAVAALYTHYNSINGNLFRNTEISHLNQLAENVLQTAEPLDVYVRLKGWEPSSSSTRKGWRRGKNARVDPTKRLATRRISAKTKCFEIFMFLMD